MLTDEERNESKQNQELFQKMVLAFELDDVEKTRDQGISSKERK